MAYPSRLGRVDSPRQRRTTTFRPGPGGARRTNAPREPYRPPGAGCVPRRCPCEARWLTPRLPLGTRSCINSCGDGSMITEARKVRERIRRPGFGHLEIEVTVDDPRAYTKPWSVTLRQQFAPD